VSQVCIYGYTAYGASKWAIRGFAEALSMELDDFGISVQVAYPPDTDTEGYKHEMLSKPSITKKISESGHLFSSDEVALSLIKSSDLNYYSLYVGLDGWMLTQVHPGMSPVTNWGESLIQIAVSGICRIIGIFYIISWKQIIRQSNR